MSICSRRPGGKATSTFLGMQDPSNYKAENIYVYEEVCRIDVRKNTDYAGRKAIY